ncbi:hypothetical protein F2P81_008446 [Scophthalmus maximus]|uniref:Uncharacterized protein n=1 Tax=Scophthalmus maximus TaxID=52904 RepID=A0A6A4TBC0_SCOMX|nr:hypothetical protein F2P81_008446 [Scophthalmus maximus]
MRDDRTDGPGMNRRPTMCSSEEDQTLRTTSSSGMKRLRTSSHYESRSSLLAKYHLPCLRMCVCPPKPLCLSEQKRQFAVMCCRVRECERVRQLDAARDNDCPPGPCFSRFCEEFNICDRFLR